MSATDIAFKLRLIGVTGGMDMLRRCLPGLLLTAAGAARPACCYSHDPAPADKIYYFFEGHDAWKRND